MINPPSRNGSNVERQEDIPVSFFNYANTFPSSVSGPVDDRLQELRDAWNRSVAEQEERERLHKLHEKRREDSRLRRRRQLLWVLGFRNRGYMNPFTAPLPVDNLSNDDDDDESSDKSRKNRKKDKKDKKKMMKDEKGKGRADIHTNSASDASEEPVTVRASMEPEVYTMIHNIQTEVIAQRAENNERFAKVRRRLNDVVAELAALSGRVERMEMQVRSDHDDLMEVKRETCGSVDNHRILSQQVGYLGTVAQELADSDIWHPTVERPRMQIAWRTQRRMPLNS